MSKQEQNPHRYDDMLHIPHPEPTDHPRMPLETRAAIFSPFAALSGYDDAVTETARLTDEKIELSEAQREELDRRLATLIDRMEEGGDNGMLPSGIVQAGDDAPMLRITYFKADEKKDGGEYVTVEGRVKKLDLYQKIIVLGNGKAISIEDVVKIEGEGLHVEPNF